MAVIEGVAVLRKTIQMRITYGHIFVTIWTPDRKSRDRCFSEEETSILI
ncbi:MAG: hypothetical protein IKR22_07210 [Clostridiales bacterium]|nr:hypothetical protein [Clostridiales bacterium]